MTKNSLSTTPKKLGGGALPSGYDEVTFILYDGNWTKETIILPTQPAHQNRVFIRSRATYNATLDMTQVDVPLTSLKIVKGSAYSLEYLADTKKWAIGGTGVSYLTPNDTGDTIPDNPGHITFYSMSDCNWVSSVNLPATAKDGSFIIIRSTATYNSKVSNTNMLYGSTTTIMTNDEYCFKYLEGFNGWVVDSAPIRELRADSITFQMPYLTSQTTVVNFADCNWISKIQLPERAGDRDKVLLKSSATYSTLIDDSNVNKLPGRMELHSGEQYDFFYIAENEKWQLMKSPDTVYQAKDITNGHLPPLTHPKTIINVSDGNHLPQLELPPYQTPGCRVIINANDESADLCSSANWDVKVVASGRSYTVSNGEIVTFKVDEQKVWNKETVIINLLLLYSDKAADRLGDGVMRNRLIQAFNMTNEALENSGANFRYRSCGLRQIVAKDSWKGLGDPLRDLRSDPTVQAWRDELKADGIYYEGTEGGGGLAWVCASSFNMVATGSINCGTTVMRHELGHNMGVTHGGGSKSYNQGYGLLKTIMAGNSIPYYSTPNRYTPDYGIPLGIPDKVDAVRAMNAVSAKVAAYR